MTKPFDTYFGGKSGTGTYQTIINQIPPHRVYVEPFVGNGGIYRNKKPSTISILADVDISVIHGWLSLGIPERTAIADCAAGSNVFLRSALDLLSTEKEWLDHSESYIYLDPPYPLSSRKSDSRYTHELDHEDHYQLLKLIDSYHYAKVSISTYPNDLYGSMLNHWRKIEYQSITRGGMATEWLFCNYPEPTELHDYRYIGNNYRERERIAKKVRRHVAKFKQLPTLERQAIISAILQD